MRNLDVIFLSHRQVLVVALLGCCWCMAVIVRCKRHGADAYGNRVHSYVLKLYQVQSISAQLRMPSAEESPLILQVRCSVSCLLPPPPLLCHFTVVMPGRMDALQLWCAWLRMQSMVCGLFERCLQ